MHLQRKGLRVATVNGGMLPTPPSMRVSDVNDKSASDAAVKAALASSVAVHSL